MPVERKRKFALVAAAVLFVGMAIVAQIVTGPFARRPAGPWEEQAVQGVGQDKIAVVNVEGEIVGSAGDEFGGSGVAAADDLVSQLQQARRDDAVRAVILRVNTPGGSVVASDEIYQEVRDLREAGKPVVASMGEVATSGGYFVSVGADRIVANQSTITGSIGVIMVLLNLERAAGKLGIEPVVIKSGRLKDIGSPFRRMTPQERAILQNLIDEAYERFLSVVSDGRDVPEGELRDIADGRLLSGLQARRAGLVDELEDFDRAVETAKQLARIGEARVVEYEAPFSLFGSIGDGFPAAQDPVEQLEGSLGVTGPVLKYLYVS